MVDIWLSVQRSVELNISKKTLRTFFAIRIRMVNDTSQTVFFWAAVILSHIGFLFINKFWGYFWIGMIVLSLIFEYLAERFA